MEPIQEWFFDPCLRFDDFEVYANGIWEAGNHMNDATNMHGSASAMNESLQRGLGVQYGSYCFDESSQGMYPSNDIPLSTNILPLSHGIHDASWASEPWLESDSLASPSQQ